MSNQSRGCNGKLRVVPRSPASAPTWLSIYRPPVDEPPLPPEPAAEVELDPTPMAPLIPDRSAWRSVLAKWSIPDRERWGRLANEYQDRGLSWNAAEWQAFQDVAG